MIDSSEPKDGDYVRYVESLVNAPKAQQLQEVQSTGWGHGADAGTTRDAVPGAAPGRFPRQAARADAGATRPDAGGAPPDAGETRPHRGSGPLHADSLEARLEQLRRTLPATSPGLPHQMRRIAGFATFAGIALIALSFADAPPFFAHPAPGILLVAAGAFLRRFARKLP